jgi:hypothetical protein
MLARPQKSTNTSPFHFKGLETQKTDQQSACLAETNRERTFRRASNACEIAAGTCLNSSVIFTFHLLQVHPVGLFLAVGVSHFYFTATAVGERKFSPIMTGASGSLALLCSLSEAMGEWQEASSSKSSAQAEIREMYSAPDIDYPVWVNGVAVTLIFCGIRLVIFRKK